MAQVIEQLPVELVPGKPRVGKVYTDVVVRNHEDEIAVGLGRLAPHEVRELRLTAVLADTGADTLSLPEELIAQLGLPMQERVLLVTAAGDIESVLYRDATVRIMGREGRFDCISLPAGSPPLLGVIPMESLGIELDLQAQTIRLLPRDRRGSHLRA